MIIADENYWIKGIELPQVRGRVIFDMLYLSNEEYQKNVWVTPKYKIGFYLNLHMGPIDTLLEEQNLDLEGNAKRSIGWICKNEEEAKAIEKVAKLVYDITEEIYAEDEVYLTSPLYPQLVQASKEGFEIFMKAEQDNKQLLEFVEVVKKNMARKISESKRARGELGPDYWISDVKIPRIRGTLIHELLYLSDEKYQKNVWVTPESRWGYSFKLEFPLRLLLGNQSFDEDYPIELGIVFKNKEEAKAARKVANILREIIKVSGRGEDHFYLNSPLYPQLIQASQEAYAIFEKNEQGNIKLMDFLKEEKEKMQKEIEDAKKAKAGSGAF